MDEPRLTPVHSSDTVWACLSAQARARGDAIAIESPGRSPLSWAALINQIEQTRRTLRGFGIGPTDRVAAILPDGPEAAVAFLSVCSAAVYAPLNPTFRAAELAVCLEQLSVRAILVTAPYDAAGVAVARRQGCAVIELVLRDRAAGTFDLVCHTGVAAVSDPHGPTPDALALVLQTSGTTSRPKIVPLTHTNICASARNVASWLALEPDDRGLVLTPQFHVNGLIRSVLSPLVAGGTIICTSGFQAPHLPGWLKEFKPTWYTAVPAVHRAAVDEVQQRSSLPIRSSLRFIRSGAAPLPTRLMMDLERAFGVPVLQGYGMTETASQVACNPLPPRMRKPGSIGLPAGPEMAIVDADGQVLGPGQTGEIVVRGANVMMGYEGAPEANAAAFANGWFRTGDQGYRDADGYYFVTGRLKDLINRGGHKISPQEIDDVLLDHASVAQAATFPVPDARLGETIVAAVVLRPGDTLTERQLLEFAARRLAYFKIPERILFVQEFPKGPNGKVKRSMLAEHLGLSGGLPSTRVHVQDPEEPDWEPEALVVSEVMRSAAEVLGVKDLDRRRNFLESGGDSVRAMLLVARLSEAFGVELTFLDVFHAPSFLTIARIITTRVLDQVESSEVSDRRNGPEL